MITDINPTPDAAAERLTFVADHDQHIGFITARQGCHRCSHRHRLRLYHDGEIIAESAPSIGSLYNFGAVVRFWLQPHVNIRAGQTYGFDIVVHETGQPVPWRFNS